MANKILIVGGVAGGASTAARLRRRDEEAEIIIFERGEYISFANCGLPYYIGDTIKDRDDLLIQTPEAMEARFNIEVRVKNEVLAINPDKQLLRIKDLEAGQEYVEDYDYLVLSPGAEPIKPPIPGVDGEGVFTLRNIPDTDSIKNYLLDSDPQRAVVVGGGFIGLEMAENLHQQGLEVAVVEMATQVMGPIDYEMAAIVHNHLREQGVELYLEDGVTSFEPGGVTLQSGKKLKADLSILAIGVKPQVELAQEAGLELGKRGGIVVNEYLETSEQNIYAIGDAIEVRDYVTGEALHIPLGGPANKQARIVANNLTGAEEKFKGVQGTAVVKVFDLSVATTGINEKRLNKIGIDYEASFTISSSHASYYPESYPMTIKTLFNTKNGQLLGAQIVGQKGVDKRIDVIATALRFGKTIFDLQELELAYAPPYSSAKDPVNMAGFVAGNIINQEVKIIHWWELNRVSSERSLLLDIRTESEYQLGKLQGAVNIPLNELRDRLDEIPKNKEIIVYCQVGIRAYIAARILMQNGFERVRNLSGGHRIYDAVYRDGEERDLLEKDGEKIRLPEGAIPTDEEGKPLGRTVELDLAKPKTLSLLVEKQLDELEAGDILKLAIDEVAVKDDLVEWCQKSEYQLLNVLEEDNFIILIKK